MVGYTAVYDRRFDARAASLECRFQHLARGVPALFQDLGARQLQQQAGMGRLQAQALGDGVAGVRDAAAVEQLLGVRGQVVGVGAAGVHDVVHAVVIRSR